MNEKIQPFSLYLKMTLKASMRKFFQLAGIFLLTTLAMTIVLIILAVPILLILTKNMNIQVLQNTELWLNYVYSGEFINLLVSSLPMLSIIAFICMFLFLLIGGIQTSMIYLIADSYLSNEKRAFGKMFSYSLKRAFPQLGTMILISFIIIGICALFTIISTFIAAALGINLYASYSDIFAPSMIAYSIIIILLSIIMVCMLVYIMLIYSMAQFARIKYKLSGIATLRYSRLLTKNKRAKILGNALLAALIYIIIYFIFSYVSKIAANNYIPLVPFIINLTVAFLGTILGLFWAIMFINFDKTKGPEILNIRFKKIVCIKEQYFPEKDEDLDKKKDSENHADTGLKVEQEINNNDDKEITMQVYGDTAYENINTSIEENNKDAISPSEEKTINEVQNETSEQQYESNRESESDIKTE